MDKAPSLGWIRVDHIRPSPFQVRENLDDEAQADLVESMRALKQSQPILVRPIPSPPDAPPGDSGQWYELASGERRWRAAQTLGWTEIWAIIEEMTDEESFVRGLAENEQRHSLNAIERAKAYQEMMQKFGWSQEEVAAKVGLKTQSIVSSLLSLLEEPLEIQQMVKAGQLSEAHCRLLRRISNTRRRVTAAKHVVDRALAVKATEDYVASILEPGPKKEGAVQSSEGDYNGFKLSWKGTQIIVSGRNFDTARDVLKQFLEDLGGAIESFVRDAATEKASSDTPAPPAPAPTEDPLSQAVKSIASSDNPLGTLFNEIANTFVKTTKPE